MAEPYLSRKATPPQRALEYALSYACRGGTDVEVIRYCLEQKTDPNWARGHRLPIPHSALRYAENDKWLDRHLEILNLLLDHGADINQRDVDLCTPIALAIGRGLVLAVKLLVDRGADVDDVDGDHHNIVEFARLPNYPDDEARPYEAFPALRAYLEAEHPMMVMDAWVGQGPRSGPGT